MSPQRNVRDTEDGINEAGWERAMSQLDRCDKCDAPCAHVTELHIDNGEHGSLYLCHWCYEVATETGAADPDNRDWDAVRELREFEEGDTY